MPRRTSDDPDHYVGIFVSSDTHHRILMVQAQLQTLRGKRVSLKEAMTEIIKRGLASQTVT